MQKELDDEELVIDYKKLFNILSYRKNLAIKIIVLTTVIVGLISLFLPKKYDTSADIYVSKTSNTNLAELNPYIIASMTNGFGGLSSMFGPGMGGLQDEIEIMKSPLVMDNVIRENNLKYKKGPKKGEFISTQMFLKKNIAIENKKGSNIISISYKSKDPLLAYNVVNSIIKNYQKVNEEINTKKTVKDKKLLENSYAETSNKLNQKLNAMEHTNALPDTAMNGIGMLAALKGHSRAIGSAVGSVQSQMIQGQKSQIAVDQEVEKLKLVKTKLEWTNLVEKMAKDTTNTIILKQPEVKNKFESSEPKLLVNLFLGLLLGLFASIIAVVFAEKADKNLTYSELGDNVIYDIQKNFDDLKILLLSKAKDNISMIIFDGVRPEVFQNLSEFNNLKVIRADITPTTINEILYSDKLILAAKIGKTPKKMYQQIKNACAEINKPICFEIV